MEIVDVEDPSDRLHGVANRSELQVAWCALKENVERFADNADGTPEDHGGDDEGENGVDPRHAGEENSSAANDDGGGGESVAEHVEKDAADVDVAGEAPEESGYCAVHQDAGRSDVHHQPGLNGDGNGEAVDGLEGDPDRENDQGGGVDECREDTRALIAEGFLLGCRAGLEVDSDEGEEDCKEIAEVVAGFGDEGQGVGTEAEDESGDDVGEGQRHGELQDALHLAVRGGDHVHVFSVVRAGVAFNSAFL